MENLDFSNYFFESAQYKKETRERIKKDTDIFLNSGGVIEKIPYNKSKYAEEYTNQKPYDWGYY